MALTARQAALVAGLAAAVVAAPSIGNEFVGDDRWVIAERPFLKAPPSVSALVREPYWSAAFGGEMWRPAVLASYALDYRISSSPHWFHAVNVLWAGLAAALLTLLACAVTDAPTGLVAGLLFAVHPVHVEAVANVVGRAELMAAVGYAAALLCAVRADADGRRGWLVGVALAATFAIGSKEHAATLPVAVLCVAAARRRPVQRAVPAAAVAAVVIIIYFLARGTVAHGAFGGGLAPGLEGFTLPERAWAMLALSLEWWRLLLVPVHLSADYSPAELVPTTAFTLAHAGAALVWAGAGWAAWRWRSRVPALALGVAWVVVTLGPVSNVLIPTEILLAERTLYLPSWGVALALAGAGAVVRWPARARGALLTAVLVVGATRSVARVDVWHDDDAAFDAALHDAPRSYRTRWMLGKDEFAAGRWGTGERLLREAITAAPHVTAPRMDLARAYVSAERWRPAAALLRETTAIDSSLQPAWVMLPQTLLGAGDTTGAVAAAGAALRRFPDDAEVVREAKRILDAAGRP